MPSFVLCMLYLRSDSRRAAAARNSPIDAANNCNASEGEVNNCNASEGEATRRGGDVHLVALRLTPRYKRLFKR